MRGFLWKITLVVAFVASVAPSQAQQLRVGADFTTFFDNKEYTSLSADESCTLFSARLTPKVGIAWAECNELMFGVDMVQEFGHDAKFLSDVGVQLYYALRAPRVKVLAGIFPRSEMRGLQQPLFFDRDYRYYHHTIAGVLVRYESAKHSGSYVEMAMDYTGMRDRLVRESFDITLSAYHRIKGLELGLDGIMRHYGKDLDYTTDDGVVDNLLVVPYVGYELSVKGFDFDFRLSYMQALQRDRHFENRWQAPMGGELYCAVSRWGVTLANRLYVGGCLMPFMSRYGASLYHGERLYATAEGIVESAQLSYCRSFFDDTLSVGAGITLDYDGTGIGTRQWVQLDVKLDYGIDLRRKQRELN